MNIVMITVKKIDNSIEIFRIVLNKNSIYADNVNNTAKLKFKNLVVLY